MCISSINAERVFADGWREITVPPWTSVSIGEGWLVIVTPAAIRCDCGKGLDCSLNITERTSE